MSPSIVHLTGRAGRAAMGISSVIWGLSSAQLSRGDRVNIWCTDKAGALESAREYGISPDVVASFPIIGPEKFCFSPQMMRAAKESHGELEVLHQHGLWTVSAVANIWRRAGAPTVLAFHGSLEPWALKKSSWRKAAALALFEGKNLKDASCLHATSIAEVGEIRDFGLKRPIALIHNGVSAEWLQSSGESDRFRDKFGMPKGKRIAFFLSRITPKKGLPILLEAWAQQRHRLKDWCLVIAGSDEFSHRSELISQVKSASLEDSVIFLGPLYNNDKRDAFAASEVFVLPSHGEGAPMAVLDSLGAGVPVLTTQRTPWEDLCRHRCGWWVDDTAGALAEALVDMSQQSPEDLANWGARGKTLVSRNYSWESSAEKCHQLYRWLLHMAEMPQCVQTD